MNIGYIKQGYPTERLITNKVQGARYINLSLHNFFTYIFLLKRTISKFVFKKNTTLTVQEQDLRFFPIFSTKCDLLHFFNIINYSNKNWLISVETVLPWNKKIAHLIASGGDFNLLRNDKEIEKSLQILSKSNCLAVLPLSKCSYNIQMALLSAFPKYKLLIENKLQILHPQQKLITEFKEKEHIFDKNDTLHFIFVARDFFRKGGRELVQVLVKLHEFYNFKLTIISSFRVDDTKYIYSEQEPDHMKQFILKQNTWIDLYDELPNAEVLRLISDAHVAFLPTWMDTYAYSVLECQACGTPVVSTNIRALPEINGDSVGYLIKVPVNRYGHPVHNTAEEKQAFSEALTKGLESTIMHIIEHKEELKTKSKNCIERIINNHSPENYNNILSKASSKQIP